MVSENYLSLCVIIQHSLTYFGFFLNWFCVLNKKTINQYLFDLAFLFNADVLLNWFAYIKS